MELEAGRYQPVDIAVRCVNIEGNSPFSERVEAVIRTPSGEEICLPGFYYEEDVWHFRFLGTEEGIYHYEVRSETLTAVGDLSGNIRVSGMKKDAPRLLRTRGRKFILDDGSGIFLTAYECDFIFSMLAGPDGLERVSAYLDRLKEAGFNLLVFNVYAYDLEFNIGRTCAEDFGPPYIELWKECAGGRAYNPEFFKNLDTLLKLLYERSIYGEMYFKVYNKMVPWPEKYSREEEDYIYHVTARYQGYPNVVWNFTKEGYFEKDKEYIYHCFKEIKALDCYKHLCTIHDDLQYALDPRYAETIDFITLQQQGEMGHACLYYGERTGKPVINGEFGNECGPNGIYDTPAWKSYSPEDNARFGFQSVFSGAYAGYYYAYAAWDIIRYQDNPKGFQYYGNLIRFFKKFDFNQFVPAPELCAWSGNCMIRREDEDPEEIILVYLEPKDERLYLLYTMGQAHINPDMDRRIKRIEKYNMFSGTEENLDPKELIVADEGCLHGSLILNCSKEPCVFVLYCEKRCVG